MITLVLNGNACPLGSNASDEEVLRFAEAQFTTPTPLIQMLMQRLAARIYNEGALFQNTGEAQCTEHSPTRTIDCPACGCGLVIKENAGE